MTTMTGTEDKGQDSSGAAEHWGSTDSWLFATFVLGMILEMYIFSIAPIATGWVKEPASLRSLLLAWAPLWLIIGIAAAGPLGDAIGRRATFYITMSLYAVGALGLALSGSYGLILVFLAVLLLAAGGEMNMIMVASHELMPSRHRSKVIMLALNLGGIGGILLSAIDLSSASTSISFQRVLIGASLVGVLIVLFLCRTHTPESIRWLLKKGRTTEAERELERYYGPEEGRVRRRAIHVGQVSADSTRAVAGYPALWVRLVAIILVAFANTTAYGLLVFTLGPVHFPKLTAEIILVNGIGGFIPGLIFAYYADRLSRRWTLVIGYAGTVVFTAVALVTESVWVKELALFWTLVVILAVFTTIGYLTEDCLKGEVWPTVYRSRFTSLVRFVSIGGYIGTIYLTQHFTVTGLVAFNLVVWCLGLVGAVLWFLKGIETGLGRSIEVASGEIEAVG